MKRLFTSSLFVFVILVNSVSFGQDIIPAPTLKLQKRELVMTTSLPELIAHVQALHKRDHLAMVYIQPAYPVKPGQLEKSGITLQDYVQGNVYTATISRVSMNLEQSGILSWAPVAPEDKVSPWLDRNPGNGSSLTLLVAVAREIDQEELRVALAGIDARLSQEQSWLSQHIFQVELPAQGLYALAALPCVRYITPWFHPQVLLDQAIGYTNTQKAHQPLSVGGYNLKGEGVTIGVGDDSDPQHVDMDDRIVSFNPILASTHGFHTTGTVGGGGLKDQRYEGYAPKCNLISDFFSQIIANGATYHKDFDMSVTSNSYGNVLGDCAYAGTYDIYSQFTDQQMRDYPELLNVFAAANDANLTCAPYPQGYATVTASYSTAKNVLTVANMGHTEQILSAGSSRGPVKDGRLKPEITAVGTRLYATIDNENYAWNTGTSMACPNVAGAAGLLYQRYKQLKGNQNPPSGLVKALLMNGAKDQGIPGPDFRFGFGLMNTGHSLRMIDSGRYLQRSISLGQLQTFNVVIPANTALAKIMLYWHDPAATPLSTRTLVNDLDLKVTTPGSVTVLPLVPDPAPGQVTTPATEKVDRINNVEQVTLNNPAPGTYTISVEGFDVPVANQEYFIVYDFVPEGVTLQYPFGGEALSSGDSMRVYWEASAGTNAFSLYYSIDNGGNWNTIDNNIAADLRSYVWNVPASIASGRCLVRVVRNGAGQESVSKSFTLINRPKAALTTLAEQCPGAIKLAWNIVPGASGYRVFKKIGGEMAGVATVTGTTYTFQGLSPDSVYWVAVAPVIDGGIGMRSIALSRKPDNGNCLAVVPGDLSVSQVVHPANGRIGTASHLGNAEPLQVVIRNFDNQAAGNYRISYQLNGGAWQNQHFNSMINPAGSLLLSMGSLDLSATGNYRIKVAVTNLAVADPVGQNDTIDVMIKHLDNPAINLDTDYVEGFESITALDHIGQGYFGLEGADRWDFTQSQQYGRIRGYVNSAITIEGNGSVSMDNRRNQRDDISGSSLNTLTGTFNLSEYAATPQEIRCSFEYILHGSPKFDTANQAWIRGSDQDPWLPLYRYQIDTSNLGVVYHSGSLSLSDFLAAGGQDFSSSTQVRFGQYDTAQISATYFGNGLTMDNFKLYTVKNDIQLIALDSVYRYNCGLSNAVPVRIKLSNGVSNTLYNVAVSYRLDDGEVVTEYLDSIGPKDTIVYTFNQSLDLSAQTHFNLSTWVFLGTDTYRLNDSLLNIRLVNQPVVVNFPYLQDFEMDEGAFYAEGNNSSWAYGTPSALLIDHAASGTKAWKTNLSGNYNKRELSYLYTPCFDISQLDHPTLSFHIASDIELPGDAIFDVAYVEYSNGGDHWQRLGQAGEGTNWYENDTAQAWARTGATWWKVATIPIPKTGAVVSFRFVLHTDQGAEFEGVAIDDVHIYDLLYPVFDEAQFPAAISRQVSGGQAVDFIAQDQIGLSIMAPGGGPGMVTAQAYKHQQFINEDSTQYYLPKNFTIQTTDAVSDSIRVRFYVTDEAIRLLREDQSCYSCSKPYEVQQLGLSQYKDADKSRENNSLADNINGSYSFLPKDQLRWVPYGNGYYAEVMLRSFSEFWFNNGGPSKDQDIAARLFQFLARHYGTRYAELNWSSAMNSHILRYDLQRANGDMDFVTIASIEAKGDRDQSYQYIDTPVLANEPRVFYRISYQLKDGTTYLSLIRNLEWPDAGLINVYPNPVRNGILTLEWFKGNDEPLEWAIYSIVGQRVNHGKITENVYSGKRFLNMSDLAITPGVYILTLKSGQEKREFKLVYQ